MSPPRVVVITDPSFPDDHLVAQLDAALGVAPAGSLAIQLRDRARPTRDVLRLGQRLAALAARWGAMLIVNDRVDLALALDARGVHLGGGSVELEVARALLGPEAFISVAAHTVGEVLEAERAGATAALLSPIYRSPKKGPPIGPAHIRRAREAARSIALYALGGVDASNARDCVEAGATGVAVIRAILGAPDAAWATRMILAAFAA